MLVRPVQPENALLPIVVTLLGMVMLVRPQLYSNAPSPMEVTFFGIMVFSQPAISLLLSVLMIALQPFRESYFVLPSSTTMLVRPLQPENA